MSIKYAVLGLINEEPSHGYAIHAAFEERLGHVWDLNYGQVYQVLNALENEGLIAGRDERVGRRPLRKVFTISPKGRKHLQRWLTQVPSRKARFRDDFYVRLLFAHQYPPELLRETLTTQIRLCEEHLAGLIDQREAYDSDLGTADSLTRQLFTEAAILHAEADVRALMKCRSKLLTVVPAAAQSNRDEGVKKVARAKRA